jgi:hypothetical protein
MGDIDDQQRLNVLHVPEDAGEHADALRGIPSPLDAFYEDRLSRFVLLVGLGGGCF